MLQANTEPYPSEDLRKYRVGQRLLFRQHDPEENIVSCFRAGDVLTVCDRNGCGMGIDCTRLTDGVWDMVWANEVDLLGAFR